MFPKNGIGKVLSLGFKLPLYWLLVRATPSMTARTRSTRTVLDGSMAGFSDIAALVSME
jgi:hypothetical protein